LKVVSPWSGEVVGEVSLAGPGEWEAAITATERAAATLRKMSSQERRDLLEALVAGVKACQAELAQTIVAEGGKPITYARAEVSRGVMTLSLAAEEAARLGGEVLPQALALANDSDYGLQAGVFTPNLAHMWQAFETLEVGGVIINDAPVFRLDHMPYGGTKASGLGREGVRYAMEELTDLRLLALKV
jgi:acyl-CoA reductase-like NAD-dependent aldehyde dehydrogenase